MLATTSAAFLTGQGFEPMAAAPVRGLEARRLRQIFEEQFDFTWALLRRLGLSQEDADDAVQEVFIVVARRLSEIRAGSERAYLVSTAVRVASTSRRGRTRRREEPADAELLEAALDPGPGPDEVADLRKARQLLDSVLDHLSDELRLVFVLFELEGLTLVEIAQVLSLPLGTAKSRLRRAREQFDERADELRARLAREAVSP
jgi:RNA polymerase sigma-70 factor (ECF subfamily)